ncbi:hypothetical protein [Lentibacillus amyloliquefaciens]|uniref:YneQ n=1 Tax=Lentibacillus amyloliquefaciens TaxID=1472767 RepID=A0A0U4F519_9BACI|nr:hypothetical protein [Lentibacillus amyloliquefaciens]ALX47875.1 hypothetical protein AOX59_04220 [Lentibacillus amyloliquefaciens]
MAFGINRRELQKWKKDVKNGQISFLTHYWIDERFPGCDTVTKVGCNDLNKLINWGAQYSLQPKWIHNDEHHPHFDLFGEKQARILRKEQQWEQIKRFEL